MSKLKLDQEQAREGISYLVFGVLTTALNIQTYMILSQCFGVEAAIANAIAWIAGVVFAYVTNKIFVFRSKQTKVIDLLREVSQFVAARLATGVIDEIIVVVGAYIVTGWTYETLANLGIKVFSNGLVIVLNYVFSKLFVFKKKS